MSNIYRKTSVYLGITLVGIGVIFNKPFIELTIVPDKNIDAPIYQTIIFINQIISIISGIFFIIKQPSIRIPKKAEVLLLTSSVLVTFIGIEIGSRLWLSYLATADQHRQYALFTALDSKDLQFIPHHYLNYYPTPNFRKGLTFHNSLGYRNREFSLEKPNGVYRIVALGGSTTYTVRVEDNEKTFTAQLERLLRDEYRYPNVEVINAGVPGYNSHESLMNLQFRVLDINPDLIVIYEGTNDVHARMVEPSAYRGDNSGRRKQWEAPPIPLWEHSTLLRVLSRKANLTRQVAIDDFVSAPSYRGWPYLSDTKNSTDLIELLKKNPPIYFRRNLENIIAVARAHDIKVMFATWAHSPYLNDYASTLYYRQGFDENNQVVKDVANNHSIPLFDFASVMPKDKRYWADGRHVNEAGALVKARLFAEFIHSLRII
jgi:lysophospholipase L1-like esterase